MSDVVDKATAWDALAKARDDERNTILAMLINAARQRDSFTVGTVMLQNTHGDKEFIAAARIDAVIDAIRARSTISSG